MYPVTLMCIPYSHVLTAVCVEHNGFYVSVHFLEHFNVEMASGFVGEDKAGKERKRRHIGGYDGVFVTLAADAGTKR